MSNEIFNDLELDAIGEIMNISLGSSATAVSNLLDHRVDITTPKVSVMKVSEFSLGDLQPAVGVEIQYITGLEGSNLMLLKLSDVKIIVDILMGMETPEEEFELNELTLSAVCEVMNQMMGSASTALSDFLGRMVNISTPQTFDGDKVTDILTERLPSPDTHVVVVEFALSIEGSMESRFVNVMSVKLAKELVAGFGLGDDYVEEEVPAPAPQAQPEAAAPAPAPAPAPSDSGRTLSQEEIEQMMAAASASPPPQAAQTPEPQAVPQQPVGQQMPGQMPGQMPASQMPGQMPASQMPGQMPASQMPGQMPVGQMPNPQMGQMPPYPYYVPPVQSPGGQQQIPYYYMPPGMWGAPVDPSKMAGVVGNKVIPTQPVIMPSLNNGTQLNQVQAQNLDLIMSVPLEIAVEIGRTRKKVQEILSLSKGSLVVLDKLAGDQVDIFVNGKCIAHGDVVVIDDNFGIRISEVLNKPTLEDLT